MLILLTGMMMAVNYQEESIDDRVSFRLGEGDSTFEIIQKFDPGEMVQSNISNLNSLGQLKSWWSWLKRAYRQWKRETLIGRS